jgi:hypothetical protein
MKRIKIYEFSIASLALFRNRKWLGCRGVFGESLSNRRAASLAVGQAPTSGRKNACVALQSPGSSDDGLPIPNYRELYGRGRGVGRPLGVGTDLGVGVGLGVGVAVGVGVTVGVGVLVGVGVALGDAVGVGVGVGCCPPGNTRT